MEICEIIKVRYNAEDLNYKKVLKYRLPAVYKEFKNIFLKDKAIPYPYPKIIIYKLN